MQFAIVADGAEVRVADELVSALSASGIQAVCWTSQQFAKNRSRVAGQARVLFLADCAVGKVMRRMVTARWSHRGVRYGMQKRMGFLWVEDDVVDRVAAFRALAAELDGLKLEAHNKRTLGRDAGHPSGALVAHHYLGARRDAPLLRMTGRAFDARMLRRQLEYGLTHLLLYAFDGWLDVALTPAPAGARLFTPPPAPRTAGPSTGFVAYEESNLRNPTSSTVPPPPRRIAPDNTDERRAIRRQLADVDEDLHRAMRVENTREEAVAKLPPDSRDRPSRERELELARKNVRRLRTRQAVLKRQLDALLAVEDRTPRP